MENNNSISAFESFDNLSIEGVTKIYFIQAAKWSKFLGGIGFVFTAMLIFTAISLLLVGTVLNLESFWMFAPWVSGILMVLVAAMSFFSALFLFNFGNLTIKAIESNSRETFEKAIFNIRSWFRLIGISTLVALGIYILDIILSY